MNTINPKSLRIIKGFPPVAQKGDKVALDTEFFNQQKERLHRPHGDFAFLGCSFDGETVYYITDPYEIEAFMDNLDKAVHIYHHAKYDIRQMRRFAHLPMRKKLWDTMLIEQIMFSGMYNEFSLADVARRHLGIYLEKAERSTFSENETGQMTREQIEYASLDVAVTRRVYAAQREIIDENDLNIWKEIELPFMWTTLAIGGVKLNSQAWLELARKNKEIADEVQGRYGSVYFKGKNNARCVDGLNLASPKQVKDKFKELGMKRIESTDASALEEIVNGSLASAECKEFARDMLTYRTYSKRASTYGEKFIEEYVEEDGKIYGDLYQMGAETGRTSSRNPNLQNIPHEIEYRDCFIADEGNCMVVADYGSQEPRFAAHFSQDPRLIKILNSDKKLYIEIARDAFHMEITKQHEMYSHTKSTILGIFYGMSAFGLSVRLGVTEDEAQEMIDKILETYPGIQDYINRQSQAGDYVQSVCGRKVWLNKYDKGWLRGALNYPIQGSAADATKKAAYRFLCKWEAEMGDYAEDEEVKFYQDSPLRLLVHDEIVVEVPEQLRETAMRLLEEAMVEVANGMHTGIKGVADVFYGNSWSCKH